MENRIGGMRYEIVWYVFGETAKVKKFSFKNCVDTFGINPYYGK